LSELGSLWPDDLEPGKEFLGELKIRRVAAAHEKFHYDDAGNSKRLGRFAIQSVLRSVDAPKAIDWNIGIDKNHLGRALPALRAQSASESGAILDIRAIPPDSNEFGVRELSQRRGAGTTGRGDDQDDFRGTCGDIRRKRQP